MNSLRKYVLKSLLIISIILIVNPIFSQTIYYVKHDASGVADGTSWTDAFTDLQSALDVVSTSDSIWVAAGTYKPTTDTSGNTNPSDPRTKTFQMVETVAVIGGFEGTETQYSESNPENNETILSGDIGIEGDDSDNSYHIIFGTSNYSLTGFTITAGNANVSGDNRDLGGGVLNYEVGGISIENCRFIDNNGFQGGAITNYFCTDYIHIQNCWFIADTALNNTGNSGNGGAIGNWDFAPIITNCVFVDNYAYTYGGAIFNWGSGSTTELINCVVYNNNTSGSGGAVHNRGVTSSAVNSILWNNYADDFAGTHGGALSISYSCIEDAGYSGSHNISTDPLFIDPTNFDFRLQYTSPCIDAANGNEAPDLDMDENPRYDMPYITNTGLGTIDYADMGAFERQDFPEVCGHVTQDTTWNSDTIRITCEVIVDDGATLTIEPGTVVDFTDYYTLTVKGVILAEGTSSDSIVFTTNDPATGYHGIRFESNTSTDSSKFRYCTFEYGKATGTGYDATGGAIYSDGFDLISIENCTFFNNSATGGGAIYLKSSASPVIRNSRFINNEALGSSDGGAIYFEWQSTAKVINNLFANNEAGDRGGAMVISNSDIILTNNTIVNNSASSGGGAIWFHTSDGSDISTIKNCIIYGNSATNGSQFSLDADADPDIYNCDIEGGSSGFYGGPYGGTYTDNMNSDPVFVNPSSGTGNQSDALSAEWTLQVSSPCINAGLTDTSGLYLPSYDIAGNERVINNRIDMGAYEAVVFTACGNISSDTDWNADTVKVTCDVTIDDSFTLTIAAGTVVEFQDYYSITVNGCLKAEGTTIDSIKFTVNDTTGFADTSIVDGGWAGIIYNSTAVTNDSSMFAYCHFEFGKACTAGGSSYGGALNINDFSKISITHSCFKNNMASGMYAGAGALGISASNIHVSNCLFLKNIVKGPYYGGGGAINIADASPEVYYCQFFNNVADSSSGGAIYIRDNAQPYIINNVFANNYARYGGAMLFASNAIPAIYNNTIAYNESKFGGGITCYENSDPLIKNNILFANTDSAGGAQVYIFDNASSPDFAFNNIQGGEAGFDMPDSVSYTGNYADNLDSDPLFVSPSSGSGLEYDGHTADWTLQEDNPCINAGIPDTAGLHIPTVDLAGETRIFNDVRIDIGAYEFRNNPPEIHAQAFDIDENSGNTTLVGTCAATDIDGDNFSFSIVSGNTNNAFAIDNDGNITVNNSAELNYENVAGQKFDLYVQVEDDGFGTLLDTAIVTINLHDLNDPPVINPFVFSLDENSANTTIVGTVTGTDEDIPAQSLSYAIIGGTYAGNFAIDVSTGEISVVDSTPLNYELNTSINVTVQVQDDGEGSLTDNATVTINLNDVNDYPVITNQQFSVDEQSDVGTSIGTVVATDADSPPQNLTYAIVSGNENTAFSIVPGTGELQINNKDSVDYELATSQVITIEVTDDGTGNLASTANITVNINNINDNAPVFKDTTVTHSEFAYENKIVCEFIATDADEQFLSFSFVSGNEDDIFYLLNGNSHILYFSSNGYQNFLNYEDYQSFNLVMAVSDGDSITEANVTINIEDENEYPSIDAFEFNLDENASIGTMVGTISGTDPDIGQNLYYFITSGTYNNVTPFALDSVTGEISVIDSTILNFEGYFPTMNLGIEVRDDGEPSLSAYNNITIHLNDVNEAPVVSPQTYPIYENATPNMTIATINVTHEDAGQSVSFEITEGNDDGIFDINPASGQIFVVNTDSLDYEKDPILEIVVKATDNSSEQLSDTALITFNVQDVDEAPIMTDYEFTIDENLSYEAIVGTVQATDPENGEITYSLVTNNFFPPFAVNRSTGEIWVAIEDSIDYEHRSQFLLTIAAHDNNGHSTEGTVTINLNDLNEAPIVIQGDFYIQENNPENTVVDTVDVLTDAGETLTFSITDGNTYDIFAIHPLTGEIFVSNADSLNYELVGYFELTVRATDNSPENYWGENVQVIYVQNVNDAPFIDAQTFTFYGDPWFNPYIGQVQATDEDFDMIRYYIEEGNLNGVFQLSETSGELSFMAPDEIIPDMVYSLNVRVEDDYAFDTAIVTVNIIPQSIDLLELADILSMYPNPVEQMLNIKLQEKNKDVVIQILDVGNQVLYKGEMHEDVEIDCSNFVSGMYIMHIIYNEKHYYKKLIKK